MIDFYFWTTPNGYKVLQYLEETGMPYRVVSVNISEGEQFEPSFLKISPNNKMPSSVITTKPHVYSRLWTDNWQIKISLLANIPLLIWRAIPG